MKEKYHNKYGNEYLVYSEINNELMELSHSECKKTGIVSDYNKVLNI